MSKEFELGAKDIRPLADGTLNAANRLRKSQHHECFLTDY